MPEQRSIKKTLIIDADDTLWETEAHYQQSYAAFAQLMSAQGFAVKEARRTVVQVDLERVSQVGYAPDEFCHSLVIAYQRLCQGRNQPTNDQVSQTAWTIGQMVVDYPIVLFEGVQETLQRLKSCCRLLLLTKGDGEVQRAKLARSGLAHFFEHVHVVPEKNVAVFQELVARYSLPLKHTWMVGDSPRSDINPALQAGLGAVHIPRDDLWELEHEAIVESDRVTILRRFAELAEFFKDARRL